MNWRLLLHGAASGAWNMAVDEALLRMHAEYSAPPTVRFYDWQPACLSLGRFQEYSRLPRGDFDVVRRPTGGRAVWHHHEITYSAVIREELLPAGATSVVGAYRWLSAGLVRGLAELGIAASLAKAVARQTSARQTSARQTSARKAAERRGQSTPSGANCFNSAAQCDFLVAGRKLIGAAQARKHGAILQHGAILLEVEEQAWQNALDGAPQNAITLRELGVRATRAEIIAALARGLQETLAAPLRSDELAPPEIALANRLHAEKYTQAFWNREGILPRVLEAEAEPSGVLRGALPARGEVAERGHFCGNGGGAL
jgi:lipoate-protein ligase A